MNNELNIAALKHGLITGLAIAVIVIFFAFISRDAYMGAAVWFGLILSIGLPVYFGLKEKGKLGGYISFGEAFAYFAIAYFIASFFWEFADITVLGVMDPAILDIMLEEAMPQAEEAMRMFIDDESLIEEQLDKTEVEVRKKGSYMFLLTNSWWFLIKALVLGAIGGLIIKKSKPDFEEEITE